MKEIIALSENISLGRAFLLIFAAYFILKTVKTIYDKVTFFHDEIQKREHILNSIDTIATRLDHLQDGLDRITKESRDYRRASMHDKITKAHAKYTSQGYVTQGQLENFQMCLDRYYEVGGNGVVKNKLEKEVFDLEVRAE